MIRPFEAFVGLRYTRARKRSHFISFISLISILGITLGITALITTLSVMNGFGKELRGRILGVISHVTITETNGQLRDWKGTASQLQNPRIIARAPDITGQGMVSRGKTVSGVMVRGILPSEELQVSEFGHRMLEGRLESLKPGEFGVVIGSAIAWKLDLTLGSPVSLVIPQALV
ncbi:MAG TPA: ABC transporter permease, partial [Sulfuricaulis sp.]|nr:ABC transporter permease [Sulfuricaulis sp.]